jgi:hypothetical protein
MRQLRCVINAPRPDGSRISADNQIFVDNQIFADSQVFADG